MNSLPVRGAAEARSIVSFGGQQHQGADVHVAVATGRLLAQLGLLRAIAAGRLSPGAGHDGAALAEVAAILAGAAFAVLLYHPAELGDLGVAMLQGLVKDLNETTRCSSLPPWRTGAGPGRHPGRRLDERRRAADRPWTGRSGP